MSSTDHSHGHEPHGRAQGDSVHEMSAHGSPGGADTHSARTGHDHGHMVAEFKKRFWTSLLLTLPVLVLSPMIQHALGIGTEGRFPGDTYVLAVLSSAIYFYGGWPFLQGLSEEVRGRAPGMMTLIGVAITAAYIYSVATVLGLPGDDFF